MPNIPLTSNFAIDNSLDTSATLYVPPVVSTTLAVDLSNVEDDEMLVTDLTGAMFPGICVVDNEAIGFYRTMGKTKVLELRRGLSGSAVSHTAGATVTFHPQYGGLKAIQDAVLAMQAISIKSQVAETINNLDLNITTKQNLYTVPTGKILIVQNLVARKTSGNANIAVYGFGYNANADDLVTPALWALNGTTKYRLIAPDQPSLRGAAGDVLGFRCSVAQGSALTMSVDILGYLVPS